YELTANTDTAKRTGTLTIADQTFTVVQRAPCLYTLARSSRTHNALGGTFQVLLSTKQYCPWTAQSSVNWITVLDTSGTGQKYVRYTVKKNTTGSPRTGTLTIGGQPYLVTQNP